MKQTTTKEASSPSNSVMRSAEIAASGLGYSSILHDIEGRWQGGDMVGIIGPNGAGKSTLLRIFAGVWKASTGSLLVNDRDIHTMRADARARQIAYLPQFMSDQNPYTVCDYIAMGRYVYRTPSGALTKVCRQRIDEGIHRMNLDRYKNTPILHLSGGERQRASIARCFVQESPILLLDEPIASLDLYYQMDILRQLKQLAAQGYLVMVVLHNIELAVRYCSRLLMLKEGRIVQQGSTNEVFTEQTVQDVFGLQAKVYADPYSGYLRMSILDEEEVDSISN